MRHSAKLSILVCEWSLEKMSSLLVCGSIGPSKISFIISLSSEFDSGKSDNILQFSASTLASLFSLNNVIFFLIIQKIIAKCFQTGRNLGIIERPCEECVWITDKSIENNRINFSRLYYFFKQKSGGTVIISSYLHIRIRIRHFQGPFCCF